MLALGGVIKVALIEARVPLTIEQQETLHLGEGHERGDGSV